MRKKNLNTCNKLNYHAWRFYVYVYATLLMGLPHIISNPLSVHLISHTHDDVGWLKTPSQYYDDQVHEILDNVIDALLANNTRRFTYVEMYFFNRWWDEQTNDRKNAVRRLISTNQLEFTLGGWCMHDEATTHEDAMMEQMTAGHQFLLNELKVVPTIGWQIDPFGHSSTNAAQFARMGFDAIFFQKINFQEHDYRAKNQELEFVWRPSKTDDNSDTDIFAHMLYHNTHGYWWMPCVNDSVMCVDDNPTSPLYNIVEKADEFAKMIQMRSSEYRTPEVAVLFGKDFGFQDAPFPFENTERIMRYINNRPKKYNMQLFYSTPSTYIKAVHNYNLTWPLVRGDFFPTAFNKHYVRSGFYTSRPAEKGYDRTCAAELTMAHQLHTTLQLQNNSLSDQIKELVNVTGVHQHHDAMPGTDLQFVADNYVAMLFNGSEKIKHGIAESLTFLTGVPDLHPCPLINMSICNMTEPLTQKNQIVTIVLFNSLSWSRNDTVEFPSPVSSVIIRNSEGNIVPSQTTSSKSQPRLSQSQPFIITFPVIDISPLSWQVFTIQLSDTSSQTKQEKISGKNLAVLENEKLRVYISTETGGIFHVVRKMIGPNQTDQAFKVHQRFMYYRPNNGDSVSDRCSSAYCFRPNGSAIEFSKNKTKTVLISRGPIFQEAYVVIDAASGISNRIILQNESDHIKLQVTCGPLDVSNGIGQEVIMRFDTNISSGDVWYTDSNGGEMQNRFRDHHPTYPVIVYEPISSNYYPVTNVAKLNDTKNGLAIVVDRSHGCASLSDGSIEVMLHRRLVNNCHCDQGYQLNDSSVIRTNQLLVIGRTNELAKIYRPGQQRINHPLQLFFSLQTKHTNTTDTHLGHVQNIRLNALPPNIRLQTIQTLSSGQLLIRLQHIFEFGEDVMLSKSTTIDLATIFSKNITGLVEVSLTGNQEISEMTLRRLKWRHADQTTYTFNMVKRKNVTNPYVVTLRPMQIRSFLLDGFLTR